MIEVLTNQVKLGSESRREGVGSYIKYAALKIREYFGKLDQKGFDELLSIDFHDLLEGLPPMPRFDPYEELENIKGQQKPHRKESLDSYKEKLSRQREALAQCRIFVERSIEFNNDVGRDALFGLVSKFAGHYGFTEHQKSAAREAINGFYTARQKALNLRAQIPDDRNLVRALVHVSVNPESPLCISVGPMSIDIEADSSTVKKIYNEPRASNLGWTPGGLAGESAHIPGVFYTAFHEADEINHHKLVHEHEHIKNKLFRRLFDRLPSQQEAQAVWTRYGEESDEQTKELLLEEALRLYLTSALDDAKDEIIAMKRDGISNYYDTFFNKDGGSYDYLLEARGEGTIKTPLEEEVIQRILVDEYREIVENAIATFDALTKEKTRKVEVTIALLTDKSLVEWPKTVKRLLGQKK